MTEVVVRFIWLRAGSNHWFIITSPLICAHWFVFLLVNFAKWTILYRLLLALNLAPLCSLWINVSRSLGSKWQRLQLPLRVLVWQQEWLIWHLDRASPLHIILVEHRLVMHLGPPCHMRLLCSLRFHPMSHLFNQLLVCRDVLSMSWLAELAAHVCHSAFLSLCGVRSCYWTPGVRVANRILGWGYHHVIFEMQFLRSIRKLVSHNLIFFDNIKMGSNWCKWLERYFILELYTLLSRVHPQISICPTSVLQVYSWALLRWCDFLNVRSLYSLGGESVESVFWSNPHYWTCLNFEATFYFELLQILHAL